MSLVRKALKHAGFIEVPLAGAYPIRPEMGGTCSALTVTSGPVRPLPLCSLLHDQGHRSRPGR